MAFSGIQGTIDFYIRQEAQLTNDVTDILTNITRATKTSAEYATKVSSEREEVKADNTAGSTTYENKMNDINNEYELQLSQINSWESELETQKQQKETELEACTSYKTSYQSMLKSNVKTDFTYAQSSSS